MVIPQVVQPPILESQSQQQTLSQEARDQAKALEKITKNESALAKLLLQHVNHDPLVRETYKEVQHAVAEAAAT